VFFEYGPMQPENGKDLLALPICRPIDAEHIELEFHHVELPHVRGIWIVQDGDRLFARLYGGFPEVGLQITPGSWFRWKGDELVVDEAVDPNTAEDERLALSHALGVLENLALGRAKLLRLGGSHYCIFLNRC
jgi:hypothetical protein